MSDITIPSIDHISETWRTREPYWYITSHYVIPIVLLSLIGGGALVGLGHLHPSCSIILFTLALSVSVYLYGLTYIEQTYKKKSLTTK